MNFKAFGPDFQGGKTEYYRIARRELYNAVKALEWSLDQENALALISEKAGSGEPFTVMIGMTVWGVTGLD